VKRIEEIIAACLDDIEAGTATLEECLDRNREISGKLEPLLRLALDIEKLPAVVPSPAYKARARANLMEYIYNYPVRLSRWQWVVNTISQPGWARAGAVLLAALVVFVGTGTGTAYASQSSLPGELLYPVKTGTEAWRAWIETDAAADSSLQLEFASRRIEEMEQLIKKSSSTIPIAISGYEKNLEYALTYARTAGTVDSLEGMAIATTNQLNKFDLIEDTTSGRHHSGIVQAEQIAVIGQIRSLRHLSETRPIRASELTIAAMHSRISRAAGVNSVGNTVQAENALRLFLKFAVLSEEIRDNYAGTEASMSIEELYQQARQTQQQLFASFSNQVASSLANEMNTAFQRMEQTRGYESGNQSQESGNQGLNRGRQGQDSDNQSKESGNQEQEPIQEPGGEEQEPGNQSPRPDNQSQESDNQEQEPGSQEPSNQSPEPSNRDQGSDYGDGNGSGGQQGR
jgi:hypothetical protein